MHGIEKRLLMRQLLEQGLSKSAVARSAAQLYREVRAEGYAGSYAQVKRHVGNVRPKTRGRAGRPKTGG